MCVLNFSTTSVWNIFQSKNNSEWYNKKKYIDLHKKYPLFLSDFNETFEFSPQIFKKYSNINFYENPSSGSSVVPCGQTGITKLTNIFCNFANVPES